MTGPEYKEYREVVRRQTELETKRVTLEYQEEAGQKTPEAVATRPENIAQEVTAIDKRIGDELAPLNAARAQLGMGPTNTSVAIDRLNEKKNKLSAASSPPGGTMTEEQARQNVEAQLSDRDRKILNMVPAPEDLAQLDLTQHMEKMTYCLSRLNVPQDWQKLDTTLAGKTTEPERAAIESTTSILRSLLVLNDKESLVKRSANKIEDIATTREVLSRLSLSPSARGELENIEGAVQHLFESAAHFAHPDAIKGAQKIMGLMDDEELAAARERASKMNVR